MSRAAQVRINKAWSAWADVPPGNGLAEADTSPEALLAEYDKLDPQGDAMRAWIHSLPIEQARPLAVALGNRMFRENEEARQAARKARLSGK